MRGGYSPSTDAENDFILNSLYYLNLKKKLKNKINLKTNLNYKKSTPGETKNHVKQIAGLIGSFNDYADPFHGAVPNMATGN